MEEHRIQEVREHLQQVLYPGEELAVAWREGQLVVTPREGHGSLTEDHPELYGLLLTMNERIENAGTGLSFFGLGTTLFVGLALAFNWFPNITGSLDELRVWWFYLIIGVVGLIVTGLLTNGPERAAFKHSEPELDDALAAARIPRYTLVAMINDDPQLSELVEVLKKTSD